MADGSITINTSIDDSGVKKGVKNIENGFDKLKSTVTKTVAALGIGNLTKDFISTGVQYNAEIEKYQTALTTLTGSVEEANKVIQQIKQDAATTPFDVAGLTQANQLLISTGLSADDSRETILALGNAISATGGGNDELSRMAVNLQQIKNTGKAAAVDIKQFAFAGIDIYGLLADYLGVTKQEAAEMEVTWDSLNGALIKASQEGGKYFGAMENQSKTLNGQWATLKDNFNEFAGKALTPLTNMLKDTVLPILNEIISGGENIKKWMDEHKTLITILTGIILTLTAAIIANTIAKNADIIVIWLYVTATSTATAVTTAFSAVLAFLTSPITLVILAIGALITIIVLLVKNWDTVKEKTIEIWNKVKETIITVCTNIKNKVTQIIPKVVNSIVDFFKQLPSKMLEIGKNIVYGIWNGITGATNWLLNKVKSFANSILQGIKNTLGIHSPSRVFRDEVGKFMALGIGEGFSKNIGAIYKQMKSTVDFETQKLNSNLTASTIMNVERTDNISARLESIDNDREITVNAVTNLDGKVLTQSVNKVNARQKLQYGYA